MPELKDTGKIKSASFCRKPWCITWTYLRPILQNCDSWFIIFIRSRFSTCIIRAFIYIWMITKTKKTFLTIIIEIFTISLWCNYPFQRIHTIVVPAALVSPREPGASAGPCWLLWSKIGIPSHHGFQNGNGPMTWVMTGDIHIFRDLYLLV